MSVFASIRLKILSYWSKFYGSILVLRSL